MQKQNNQHNYDIVIPIGPNDGAIAEKCIEHVFCYFSFRKLFVISSEKTFRRLAIDTNKTRVVFINEDKLIPEITLQHVREYCRIFFSDEPRGGWFFQQFLKIGVAEFYDIAPHYLIWDADTIPLKELHFFDKSGKVLITTQSENHTPYFNTMQKIWGIEKQVNYSFITEHFMVTSSIMKELIQKIRGNNNFEKNWVETILLSVDKNDYYSGFSEYETYGNYLAKYYPESFAVRKLKHKRSGGKLTKKPGKILLKTLSLFYDTASFEKWHKKKFS